MFNDNGNIKFWKDLKIEFYLKDKYIILVIKIKICYNHKIYLFKIIDALLKTWEDTILKDKGNTKFNFILNT